MFAPVYVFLKKNKKFISIKAPLDFFSPEELKRFSTFKKFFIPQFIDWVAPFRKTGKAIRTLLQLELKPKDKSEDSEEQTYPPVALPLAPYELSDACLRLIAPLWGRDQKIENFFIAVLMAEVLEPLPEDLLTDTKEKDYVLFEDALLRSSWGTFLALLIGYCDAQILNRIRVRIFEQVVGTEFESEESSEVNEVIRVSQETFNQAKKGAIDKEVFLGRPDRVSQKILSRIARMEGLLPEEDLPPSPSIYDPGGICK